MKKTALFVHGAILLSSFITNVALAAKSDGPKGLSRVFHVDCGLQLPGGNPTWQAQFDDVSLEAGYAYNVKGNAYNDPSQLRWNCS